jgi:hypothetical protein
MLWEHNQAILHRLCQVDAGYNSGQALPFPAYWLFATELEFQLDLNRESPEGEHTAACFEGRRARLLGRLESSLKQCTDDESRSACLGRIEDVAKNWTANEYFLYQLHRNLQGVIEYRFGTGTNQSGYYDNPCVCEITMHPVTPLQAALNYNLMVSFLAQHAEGAGFTLKMLGNHLNFSVNRRWGGGYQSVFGGQKESELQIQEKMIAGICRAHQEGQPLFMQLLQGSCGVGTDRANSFRVCRNRMELRLSDRQPLFLPNLMLLTMAGAEAGLRSEEALFPTRRAQFGDYEATDSTFYIRRMLQGCELDADGRVRAVSTDYIEARHLMISAELLGLDRETVAAIEQNPEYGLTHVSYDVPLPHEGEIRDLYMGIRVAADGSIQLGEVPPFFTERIDRLRELFAQVRLQTRFTAIVCESSDRTIEIDRLGVRTALFAEREVLPAAYGERLFSRIAAGFIDGQTSYASRFAPEHDLRTETEAGDDMSPAASEIAAAVEAVNALGQDTRAKLIRFSDGTVSVAAVDQGGVEIERCQNYDPAELRSILGHDVASNAALLLRPSLIDVNERIGILRPTDVPGCGAPFGRRPLGDQEWEVLRRQGRLYEVLKITADNVACGYPSVCMDLAVELCKMDGGLAGPNRSTIQYLGWQLIRSGYLYMLQESERGRAILDSLREDGKLVDALEHALCVAGQKHNSLTLLALIAARVAERRPAREGERAKLINLCMDVTADGCFEYLGEPSRELLRAENNCGLRKVLEDCFRNTEDLNAAVNAEQELERQMARLEKLKLDEDPGFAEAYHTILRGRYDSLSEEQLELLRERGNVGLIALKEAAERDNHLGHDLVLELLRQDADEAAFQVYRVIPKGYRNECNFPSLQARLEQEGDVYSDYGFRNASPFSSTYPVWGIIRTVRDLSSVMGPLLPGGGGGSNGAEPLPAEQLIAGLTPIAAGRTARVDELFSDSLRYSLWGRTFEPEPFEVPMCLNAESGSAASEPDPPLQEEKEEQKDIYQEVVDYGINLIDRQLCSVLLCGSNRDVVARMRERGDAAVEHLKRKIAAGQDAEYFMFALTYELLRQHRHQEAEEAMSSWMHGTATDRSEAEARP